jgi:hypothetical protein
MSNELLEKVIRTTEIGSAEGGILNTEQTNQFLDYIWDTTVLGKQVRRITMRSNEQDIDKVAIGERIVRGATEAVDTGENAGAIFSKISLTTKKLRLDWELSTESLEDNIEGENLEEHLARLMATQFGNDLEDLAINGDTTSSDPLLKQYDGYSKLLKAGGHVIDAAGGVLDRGVLNAAIRALPRKYLQNKAGFKFFTGAGAIQDYIYSLQAVEAGMVNPETLAAAGINMAVRPEGNAGYLTGNAFGFQIQEIPLFREDLDLNGEPEGTELWLTNAQNLLWGIKREVTIHREFKPKKDTIEYTVYVRQGVQVQHADAAVVVENLGPADDTL